MEKHANWIEYVNSDEGKQTYFDFKEQATKRIKEATSNGCSLSESIEFELSQIDNERKKLMEEFEIKLAIINIHEKAIKDISKEGIEHY